MARWGLIPFWMREKPKVPHINARAETVHKLPLFREAFVKRRCLIPATGFYECQQRDDGKQPYRFRRKDLDPFALRVSGSSTGSAARRFCRPPVGEPNPLVGGVHDRMPVMLMVEDYDHQHRPRRLANHVAPLRCRPHGGLRREPRAVNSVKNDTEACIEPGNEAISTAK